MATQQETQALNEAFFDQLMTPGLQKNANDALNDFTRLKMREDGFARRILPPFMLNDDELDMQVDTDLPCKVFEKEPDSPAAISVPFGTMPSALQIRGQRYRVLMNRIMSPRYTKDVSELRSYRMDIRQVLSDNSIKDMLAEEDSKHILASNAAMGGTADGVSPFTGSVQWKTSQGGITRNTFIDAYKTMPQTSSHLSVATVLTNNITIMELQKFPRDEMGGNLSEDVLRNGWSISQFNNAELIVTIKRGLVPDETMFMYSDPKFLGKSCQTQDTTLFVKHEAFFVDFFAYQEGGATFGNVYGITRQDFA